MSLLTLLLTQSVVYEDNVAPIDVMESSPTVALDVRQAPPTGSVSPD